MGMALDITIRVKQTRHYIMGEPSQHLGMKDLCFHSVCVCVYDCVCVCVLSNATWTVYFAFFFLKKRTANMHKQNVSDKIVRKSVWNK